jgi:hypothetical protein
MVRLQSQMSFWVIILFSVQALFLGMLPFDQGLAWERRQLWPHLAAL